MNRVLRRPMFKIGGSAATGITSGLDRKGYKDGTDEYDRALKTTERFMKDCLLYTSPSPRDKRQSRMPSSA